MIISMFFFHFKSYLISCFLWFAENKITEIHVSNKQIKSNHNKKRIRKWMFFFWFATTNDWRKKNSSKILLIHVCLFTIKNIGNKFSSIVFFLSVSYLDIGIVGVDWKILWAILRILSSRFANKWMICCHFYWFFSDGAINVSLITNSTTTKSWLIFLTSNIKIINYVLFCWFHSCLHHDRIINNHRYSDYYSINNDDDMNLKTIFFPSYW